MSAPRRRRDQILAWRRGLPRAEIAVRSARIAAHLLQWPELRRARCVLVYLALPREVQTAAVVAELARDRSLCAPAVVGRDLVLRALAPRAGLVRGALGTREPEASAPEVPPAAVDLALVPGVAFDGEGHRLGRGGGYYDRLLPLLVRAVTCGLAFRDQVVPVLEPAPWDVRVRYVCTEDGLAGPYPPP